MVSCWVVWKKGKETNKRSGHRSPGMSVYGCVLSFNGFSIILIPRVSTEQAICQKNLTEFEAVQELQSVPQQADGSKLLLPGSCCTRSETSVSMPTGTETIPERSTSSHTHGKNELQTGCPVKRPTQKTGTRS